MREGKPTAVSHGLWLNIPDYDAPTQMVKPTERNTRYVNAVMTIPKVGGGSLEVEGVGVSGGMAVAGCAGGIGSEVCVAGGGG